MKKLLTGFVILGSLQIHASESQYNPQLISKQGSNLKINLSYSEKTGICFYKPKVVSSECEEVNGKVLANINVLITSNCNTTGEFSSSSKNINLDLSNICERNLSPDIVKVNNKQVYPLQVILKEENVRTSFNPFLMTLTGVAHDSYNGNSLNPFSSKKDICTTSEVYHNECLIEDGRSTLAIEWKQISECSNQYRKFIEPRRKEITFSAVEICGEKPSRITVNSEEVWHEESGIPVY